MPRGSAHRGIITHYTPMYSNGYDAHQRWYYHVEVLQVSVLGITKYRSKDIYQELDKESRFEFIQTQTYIDTSTIPFPP